MRSERWEEDPGEVMVAMKWHEVKVRTTREACDAISDMLISMGAGGVSIEDPEEIREQISKAGSLDYADDIFISSLGKGNEIRISAYFPGTWDEVELMRSIEERVSFVSGFVDTGEFVVEYCGIDEEDWANNWKKYFKPVKVSSKITVKPSWEDYKKENADEVVIEIDPGMAFGTGTHDTTRLCLALLEKHLRTGDSVIDVGCGTGILSIAAAKLGAKDVTAIDVDDVAVKVAQENCMLNAVSAKVCVAKGELKDMSAANADVIVANIIADVVIDISETVYRCLKSGGFFIASGIIREREQEVLDAYFKNGFELIEVSKSGEWVAMVLRCRGSL